MSKIKFGTTPLESWAARKIGSAVTDLSREQISQYQLRKLRETIRVAYSRSPFYRKLLKGFADQEIDCLADLQRIPFTTADDLRQYGAHFLCVSQSDISRVVTLDTSGTTGIAKRLFFTSSDQELTLDFFQYGMAALTEPGDRVLILLPGERTGSVGDLLAKALNRLGVTPIPHGVVRSIPETLETMARQEIDCLVGIPVQVLALARYAQALDSKFPRLKSVLLSTDHVPAAITRELERVWGCEVFEHYGMTEMGLGGGTDCSAHAGYHLHEADFYFEIVDPLTGETVPEGQEGEVVVTTLTRQGMPLIRYRTGDISRFLPGSCSCGSVLRRLERITRRKDNYISFGDNGRFTMAGLDEALFAVDDVIDFTAGVDAKHNATRLNLCARMLGQAHTNARQQLYKALEAVSAIRLARQSGRLAVLVRVEGCCGFLVPGAAKRAITELS